MGARLGRADGPAAAAVPLWPLGRHRSLSGGERVDAGTGRRPTYRTRPALVAGIIVLVVLSAGGLLAPWIAPYPPGEIIGRPFAAPSAAHPLGTNDLGQDILSGLLHGARVSLGIAAVVASGSTLLSWTVGIASGLWSRAEAPLMSVADLLLALPNLPLAMLVIVLSGASVRTVMVTLVVLSWPAFARIVRAQVLTVRAQPFVEAARAIGASELRVATRHVLPATLPLLPAKLILTVRLALFGEASLAFLGLGDPSAKSWGTMLGWAFNDGLLFSRSAWVWWVLPPALCIAAAVVGTSWIASGLERSQEQRST